MALTNEDLQAIGALLKPMNDRLDKIESQVSALRYGQISLRKELKEVDMKAADTCQIALDSWGTWLETKVPM